MASAIFLPEVGEDLVSPRILVVEGPDMPAAVERAITPPAIFYVLDRADDFGSSRQGAGMMCVGVVERPRDRHRDAARLGRDLAAAHVGYANAAV